TESSLGINLSTNTTGLVRFDGGLTASTGANTAFSATVSGSIVVTDPNAAGTVPDNTLTTTTGTALNVQNTTIGANGLTFRSNPANGATNGIVLDAVGSSGGLTVTGTGTTAGSGGTIQNTVQGALFTSTSGLTLSNMNFTNPNSGNGTVNNIDNPTFNSAAQA